MQLRSLPSFAFVTVFFAAVGCGGNETATSGNTGGAGGEGGAATTTTAATGGAGGEGGEGGTTGTGGEGPIGGDRPVKIYVSSKYTAEKAAPLVVLLHGYSANGTVQNAYFGFQPVAEERGYIYAVPEGTKDAASNQFWNATDACCNFGGSAVDDSAYLSGVVDQIKAAYNIDPKRVYFVGHSNGGFMSHRMACDHADQIAAIVSLAGATFADDAKCNPSEPVAVAQIHGTADETIAYPGGAAVAGAPEFPGAVETTELWAAHDGCSVEPMPGGSIDLEQMLAGDETTVSVYGTGCQAGGHAELWTIAEGKHVPSLSAKFAPAVFDFLEAHPKP